MHMQINIFKNLNS